MGIEIDSTLRVVAWVLAGWVVVSVVATVIILRLFRARARLNDQLAADGRRADWAAAADHPAAGASGAELSRR